MPFCTEGMTFGCGIRPGAVENFQKDGRPRGASPGGLLRRLPVSLPSAGPRHRQPLEVGHTRPVSHAVCVVGSQAVLGRCSCSIKISESKVGMNPSRRPWRVGCRCVWSGGGSVASILALSPPGPTGRASCREHSGPGTPGLPTPAFRSLAAAEEVDLPSPRSPPPPLWVRKSQR